ncbi:MAG: phosphoglycerate kinase, partial [Gammaproteobacteria bacterium]|nr:phosphoglycerate kinase [Gammaproteobacteria bacterium]
MAVKKMSELSLSGRRVLIREDLNVPIRDGAVASDARILAALPTIEQALSAGASVLLMSHLGRPGEGAFDAAYSLAPVAKRLAELLGRDVPLLGNLSDVAVKPGEVAILENVRFLEGEKANSDELARRFAGLCDVFVMDAFATAHRAQASTHGVAKFAGVVCAGPLLAGELAALEHALREPAPPMVAIVGGAKVSAKLEVLHELAEIADNIIVGGGIANTFIAAAGHPVGRSLCEPDLIS